MIDTGVGDPQLSSEPCGSIERVARAALPRAPSTHLPAVLPDRPRAGVGAQRIGYRLAAFRASALHCQTGKVVAAELALRRLFDRLCATGSADATEYTPEEPDPQHENGVHKDGLPVFDVPRPTLMPTQ